jgi:hypothetical protein
MAAVTTATSMFADCYALTTVTNHANIGSTSSAVSAATMFSAAELITSLSLAAKFDKIGTQGASGKKNRLNSLRLTSTTSAFGGSSPQVDATYTSMDATALETLFGDLPNNLAKTIAITGSTGCDTLISKASSGTTNGSTTVTMANTSSLVTGMECYGTGLSDAYACTFQDTGDTVTINSHGLTNGMKVAFATIVTTTGLTAYTPYFVVNQSTNTFQVEATLGGGALTLTTDGSGTMITYPTIVTINTNVSIVLDRPAHATGTVTVTAGVLLRSIANLKGWTVTN